MTYDPEDIISNLSIDCVILGFENDSLNVLLYERALEPKRGHWALPGGFVFANEDLRGAADRILKDITGMDDIYLEQIHTFGKVDRFPGRRVITVAYYALINPKQYQITLGSEATKAKWFNVNNIPLLVFDHERIIQFALNKIQKQVRSEPIGFELLPAKFTLRDIQKLYEAVLDTEFDVRNFRKKIEKMDLLVKLNEKQQDVPHRAANLYQFDPERYKMLKMKGFSFDL